MFMKIENYVNFLTRVSQFERKAGIHDSSGFT